MSATGTQSAPAHASSGRGSRSTEPETLAQHGSGSGGRQPRSQAGTSRSRLVPGLLAGVASLAMSLGLYPLISGWDWVVPTVMIVGTITLTGIVIRGITGSRIAGALGQPVAAGWLISMMFAPDALHFGLIPGRTAVGDILATLQDSLVIARLETAPIDLRPSVLALICVSIAAMAWSVDVLTVVFSAPAAAGLPLLATYCVPAAIVPGDVSGWVALVAGVGYLMLLATDSPQRIAGWGRALTPVSERTRPGGATSIAALALAATLLVPSLLPGLGSGRWFTPRKGESETSVNPILSLRKDLVSGGSRVAFTARGRTGNPGPWRLVSDDVFTGEQWLPSRTEPPSNQKAQSGLPPPPGLTNPEVKRNLAHVDVQLGALAQRYLPLPYPAKRVTADGTWLWDAGTLAVSGPRSTETISSFGVDYLAVTPTAEQLNAAPPPAQWLVDRYTALPSSLDPQVRGIAEMVAGQGTQYEKVMSLQTWLRSAGGFVYSTVLTPGESADGSGDSSGDAVAAFLQSRRGYCVQFASAMAVMARSLGIPARVAVGYLQGTTESTGTWVVRASDAHAWPEIYFQGIGWLRFEPTPGVRSGLTPAYATLEFNHSTDSPSTSGASTGPRRTPVDTHPATSGASGSKPLTLLVVLGRIFSPQRLAWLVALLAALCVPLISTTGVLAWRRRGARSPGDRAEVAWAELLARLEELGVRPAPLSTLRAATRFISRELRLEAPANRALEGLAGTVELSRFAGPSFANSLDADPASLRADVEVVLAAATRLVDSRTRFIARWLPLVGFRLWAQDLSAWRDRDRTVKT